MPAEKISLQNAKEDKLFYNENGVKNYDCILGVPEEIAKTIEIFKNT